LVEGTIQFMRKVGFLKKVKRSGWKRRVGVVDPESVAEHSFRCAVLAMCTADLKSLDVEKMMRMMLLHDLHEAVTGDYDHLAKMKMGERELKKRENKAIREVLSNLPHILRERYYHLWLEFEQEKTCEARIARQIDSLELAFQALEYQKEGYDTEKLAVFWENLEEKITDKDLKKILDALEEERRLQLKSMSHVGQSS
jgi:putative hydrolase of HD superfamily